MNMVTLIQKKKDGGILLPEEIRWWIDGYVADRIPDYQVSALLMAICFRGLSREEIFALTEAMRRSGDTIDLSSIPGIKVDKHSSGGVGDKTTLVAAPLAAACGVPVAKMSGRGLGFTGGTIDKLESIPGLRTAMDGEAFLDQVRTVGLAVTGQTAHITPADKKLYALRDVTATVDQMGLIASSIMSKKLAAGSDAIVLDVKCGAGAFMEKEEDAIALAELMVDIGRQAGRRTIALITEMGQPLGRCVGNALEVMEAIETLKGRGPADLTELCLELTAAMLCAGGKAADREEGRHMAQAALQSGRGLEKFRAFVSAQGGDGRVTEDYSLLPTAPVQETVVAQSSGYVHGVMARRIGLASQHAGAGREEKGDSIDLSAGLRIHKKIGDEVRTGEVLATVYGQDRDKVQAAAAEALEAFTISPEAVRPPKMIKAVIGW